VTGCEFPPLDCDDGINCTVDTCEAGSCVNELLVCDDEDDCTEDSCDESTGVCAFEVQDTDGDGVCDSEDSNPTFAGECSDVDADGCDDCASGEFDPFDDGLDTNGDGTCELCASGLVCPNGTGEEGFICVPDSVEGDICMCWAPSLGCGCLDVTGPNLEECIEGQYCDQFCFDL